MATHDYVIANGTGAAVRSDLNGALAAIVSNNSSATEPATMYAYQWWADTTTGLLKQRNSANSAWITIGTLASTNLGLLSLAGGTMTGVLAVTAGTAALCGIAVSGDPNTGIYSPGADQLAIATGGTGRITVDASGNVNIKSNTLYVDAVNNRVGIGTSSPAALLDVRAGSLSVGSGYVSTLNTDYRIRLSSVGAATNNNYTVELGVSGSGPQPADSDLTFNTQTYNGSAYVITEKMRVTATGRLGIGTISPSEKLDVYAGSLSIGSEYVATLNTDYKIRLRSVGAATNSNYLVEIGTTGSGPQPSDSDLTFATRTYNGSAYVTTEKARLTATGRLGIGTTSPAYQLQASTDSAGKPSTALWTIVSDERIKEDIELADLNLCYEAIKAIPLKRYKWRDDIYTAEQVTDRRKLGWIAQDVEAIFPKAVGTHEFKYNQVFEETIISAIEEVLDDDGNVITPAQPERIERGDLISEDVIEDCRDLNSDQLYAAMYGAVQKLMAKVETLEASNADLLARLFALEGPTG